MDRRLLRGRQGQADREAAARSRSALDLHGAAMGGDDGAHEGQSEPRAARVAPARGIEPHEGLEDPPGGARLDADAGIPNGDESLAIDRYERELDLAARGRVLDGIV